MISCKTLVTKSTRPCSASPDRANRCSYDFEYEDADDDEAGDIGIENKYYNAKQTKVDNPEEAIDEFLGIAPMEQDKSEWYLTWLMAVTVTSAD
jgi:hypothetical protein